ERGLAHGGGLEAAEPGVLVDRHLLWMGTDAERRRRRASPGAARRARQRQLFPDARGDAADGAQLHPAGRRPRAQPRGAAELPILAAATRRASWSGGIEPGAQPG